MGFSFRRGRHRCDDYAASHPGFYSVVAEQQGRIVGSNFLDERNPISGIGPVTVDPVVQNQTIGRRLMLDVWPIRAVCGRFQ